MLFPELSAALVPLPSLRPQRPIRPAWAPVISMFLAAAIWAAVRATFQMRTSSTTPAKKPSATPAVVRALPTVVRLLVRALAGLPTASVPSLAPSR